MPGSRSTIVRDLILFCGIMRIFRSGLQKLPTWLKKILSSRPGLSDFERMIAVLTFADTLPCALSFRVAAGFRILFGRRLKLGQDSGVFT
jgi:hypothetical protein